MNEPKPGAGKAEPFTTESQAACAEIAPALCAAAGKEFDPNRPPWEIQRDWEGKIVKLVPDDMSEITTSSSWMAELLMR